MFIIGIILIVVGVIGFTCGFVADYIHYEISKKN